MRDLVGRHRWGIRYLVLLTTLVAFMQFLELTRGGTPCQ